MKKTQVDIQYQFWEIHSCQIADLYSIVWLTVADLTSPIDKSQSFFGRAKLPFSSDGDTEIE